MNGFIDWRISHFVCITQLVSYYSELCPVFFKMRRAEHTGLLNQLAELFISRSFNWIHYSVKLNTLFGHRCIIHLLLKTRTELLIPFLNTANTLLFYFSTPMIHYSFYFSTRQMHYSFYFSTWWIHYWFYFSTRRIHYSKYVMHSSKRWLYYSPHSSKHTLLDTPNALFKMPGIIQKSLNTLFGWRASKFSDSLCGLPKTAPFPIADWHSCLLHEYG